MQNLFDKINEQIVAVDIETTGLNVRNDKIVKIAYYKGGQGTVFSPDDLDNEWVFRDIIEAPESVLVFHNGNFDLKFLERDGFEVKGAVVDTLLLAQLANENEDSFSLKDLSLKHIGENSLQHARRIWSWLDSNNLGEEDLYKAPEDILNAYALEDVENTYKLALILKDRLIKSANKITRTFGGIKTPIDYFNEEMMPMEAVLRKMEVRGVNVNLAVVYSKLYEARKEISEIIEHLDLLCRDELKRYLDKKHNQKLSKYKTERGRKGSKYPVFNWNSTQQLGGLLFEEFKVSSLFPKLVTATGDWKCSEPAFREIHESTLTSPKVKELTHYLLKLANLRHIVSTKIGNVDKYGNASKGLLSVVEDSKVYPSFKQVGGEKSEEASGTITGRLSSAKPNLQNQDSDSKAFFVPSKKGNCFLYFDYSQIELRIAAHFSNDLVMVDAFRKDEDLHAKLAKNIFRVEEIEDWQRQVGKQSNFLMIFNGSPNRLQDQLKERCNLERTFEECKKYKEEFFNLFQRYKVYLEEQKKFMLENSIVVSPSGRIRRLPDLKYYTGVDHRFKKYTGQYTAELNSFLFKLKDSERFVIDRRTGEKREKTIYDIASQKLKHAFNQGYNFPIQSFAASIMKKAMMEISKKCYDIVNQVHDAIYIEVDKSSVKKRFEDVKGIMEGVVKLKVPLIAKGKILNSFDDKDICVLAN